MSQENLKAYFEELEDSDFKKKFRQYLEIYEESLNIYPASIRYHHNYTGGLLDHTLEVLEISLEIADLIEKRGFSIDREALIISAICHDFGKFEEYTWDKRQKRWTHAFQRNRMDHALFPILDFMDKMKYPFPRKAALIILSHAGGWSGTSVFPDFIESAILHAADLISSRLGEEYE